MFTTDRSFSFLTSLFDKTIVNVSIIWNSDSDVLQIFKIKFKDVVIARNILERLNCEFGNQNTYKVRLKLNDAQIFKWTKFKWNYDRLCGKRYIFNVI